VSTRGPGPRGADATLNTAGARLRQLAEGDLVDRRYRIVERLGEGGMAVVFEVEDTFLDDQPYALKVLDPGRAGSRGTSDADSVVARFRREVVLGQQRLQHPGIVRIHGYGRDGDGRSALHYAVVELMRAPTLERWLAGRGEVPVETGLDLIRQLAEALGHAHVAGIVHRDVKPANVFVQEGVHGPVARLADFGIACDLEGPRFSVLGAAGPHTPGWAAPEQLRGGDIGPWTDVYQLGLLAYWLLWSGQREWDPASPDNPEPQHLGRWDSHCLRSALLGNYRDRPSTDEISSECKGRQFFEGSKTKSEFNLNRDSEDGAEAAGHRRINRGAPSVFLTNETAAKCVMIGRQEPEKLSFLTDGFRAGIIGGGLSETEVGPSAVLPIASEDLVPGTLWVDPVLGMRFRFCPPGTFLMGSPEDESGRDDDEALHEVTLTRGYWLAETPVTQGQYRALTGQSPSFHEGSDDLPVEQVSWYDAVRFANRLSKSAGLDPCYRIGAGDEPEVSLLDLARTGFRLPTEAEWERAARAGSGYRFAGGDDLDDVGWYGDNSGGRTQPVAQKRVNAWGLHDMSGNVWEWVWDRFGEYPADSVSDPLGRDEGSDRASRGGCWDDDAMICRPALRYWFDPGERNDGVGFRLARTAG